jgi:hypothetical protein
MMLYPLGCFMSKALIPEQANVLFLGSGSMSHYLFLKFVDKVERGISPTVREGSAVYGVKAKEPSLTVGLVPRLLIQRTLET